MSDLTEAELAMFRETMRRREAEREVRLRDRKARAWNLVRKAAALLRERYGATKVVVYGSLPHADFTAWSDVDLAAWGIEPAQSDSAIMDVFRLDPEIQINLTLIEMCSPQLIAMIEADNLPLAV